MHGLLLIAGCKGKESVFCDLYFDYKYNGTNKEGGSCCGNQEDYLCQYPSVSELPAATPANQLKVSLSSCQKTSNIND